MRGGTAPPASPVNACTRYIPDVRHLRTSGRRRGRRDAERQEYKTPSSYSNHLLVSFLAGASHESSVPLRSARPRRVLPPSACRGAREGAREGEGAEAGPPPSSRVHRLMCTVPRERVRAGAGGGDAGGEGGGGGEGAAGAGTRRRRAARTLALASAREYVSSAAGGEAGRAGGAAGEGARSCLRARSHSCSWRRMSCSAARSAAPAASLLSTRRIAYFSMGVNWNRADDELRSWRSEGTRERHFKVFKGTHEHKINVFILLLKGSLTSLHNKITQKPNIKNLIGRTAFQMRSPVSRCERNSLFHRCCESPK